MRSGYKIFWTSHALNELRETFNYIAEIWTERELQVLASKIEHIVELISKNPKLFPNSNSKDKIRRVVVTKHNTIYYIIKENEVQIISFFSNKQNPKKRTI